MSTRFANKVVWVTGASSGIGEALARALSAEGALLVLSARRTQRLQALAAQLERPDDVLILPLDMADADAIPVAAKAAQDWKGRVDVLINNAGISQRSLAHETNMDTIRQVMEVNYFGVVHLTACLLPDMLAKSTGHIVFISSVAGYVSTPMRSAYASSKHAVRAHANTVRAETSKAGLQVTVICPGYIRTDISSAALCGDGTPKGQHDRAVLKGMDPAVAARKMLNGIHRRRMEFYVGGREVWAIYFQRFIPRIASIFYPYATPE